uniref:F-box domain-containing protein n=1 Tax=Mycena chlorophos TaxID=658473 RepID=A0ABQ0KY88_MYCCL|nr:predicted protein [Mycena chlorophos]
MGTFDSLSGQAFSAHRPALTSAFVHVLSAENLVALLQCAPLLTRLACRKLGEVGGHNLPSIILHDKLESLEIQQPPLLAYLGVFLFPHLEELVMGDDIRARDKRCTVITTAYGGEREWTRNWARLLGGITELELRGLEGRSNIAHFFDRLIASNVAAVGLLPCLEALAIGPCLPNNNQQRPARASWDAFLSCSDAQIMSAGVPGTCVCVQRWRCGIFVG